MLKLPQQAAPTRYNNTGISLRRQLEQVDLYFDILENGGQADAARAEVIELFQNANSHARKEIAERIATNYILELPLLEAVLAIDVEASLTIIMRSSAFTDDQLMDLLHCPDERISAAIIEREYLSGRVIEYSLKCADGLAAASLIRRYKREMPQHYIRDIAFRAANTDAGRAAVLTIYNIDDSIKCAIIEDWANRLASYVGDTGLIDKQASSNWSRHAVERALLVAAHDFENVANENLVSEFSRRSWISPSFLIRALLTGHKSLFITIFSQLSNTPILKIVDFFENYNGEEFAKCYANSNLPYSSIKVFAGLIRYYETSLNECAHLQWDGFSENLSRKVIDLLEKKFQGECEEDVNILKRIAQETVQDFRVSVMSEYMVAA